MADYNIMTAPVAESTEEGYVFGEIDNELVKFPASGLGGGGEGGGGNTEVPPGVVFVEEPTVEDPLPEEDEAEEGSLDADKLGGLTPPYFVKKSDLSDAFDAESAYAVGDYCIYQNALYRFTAAKEAGAWDSEKVLPVKLADEIGRVENKFKIVEAGMTNTVTVQFGQDVTVTINFTNEYPDAPLILYSIVPADIISGIWGYFTTQITQLSATKCDVNLHSLESGTGTRKIRIHWCAIGDSRF